MNTQTILPIKFNEIDHMGIVHHSNYIKWFEAGRTDYFKKAGISLNKIAMLGFYLPLSEIKCNYKSPAKYGQEIIVKTSMPYLTCVKTKLEYTVINKSNDSTIATGYTIHAWTNTRIEPINIEKSIPKLYNDLKQLIEI